MPRQLLREAYGDESGNSRISAILIATKEVAQQAMAKPREEAAKEAKTEAALLKLGRPSQEYIKRMRKEREMTKVELDDREEIFD